MKTYTKDEVTAILCEACAKKLNEIHSGGSNGSVTHHINGIDVPCLASEWRRKATLREFSALEAKGITREEEFAREEEFKRQMQQAKAMDDFARTSKTLA